jgi:hypothetical protein
MGLSHLAVVNAHHSAVELVAGCDASAQRTPWRE